MAERPPDADETAIRAAMAGADKDFPAWHAMPVALPFPSEDVLPLLLLRRASLHHLDRHRI